MDNNELLQAIRQIVQEEVKVVVQTELHPINKRLDGIDSRLDGIDSRLDGIDSRLDAMQEDIDIIKEDGQVTRTSVNKLIEWADDATIQVIPLFNKRKV